MSSLSLAKEVIIYNFEIDEDIYESILMNYDESKVLLYNDLKQSSLSILESCKIAELGIEMRFSKKNKSKQIIFEFPFSELEKDPFFITLNMSQINLI